MFKNNGKLKLLIIVGTRPEIIRLAAVINKCREYFDCVLAHTGQNYDYNLNGVFFKDLSIADPEVYMNAVGKDLGETIGNIIAKSYQLMVEIQPDALLILGDTNSCLSAIAAKRLHIPIFHMEAGNRCKDECLPEETNRRIVDINQVSVFLGMKTVIPSMQKAGGGSIVNISSMNGLVAGAIGYTDTKFAVRGMTKAAAMECANYGIRVNSVHPGVIATPMVVQEDTKAAVEEFSKHIPMKRVAQSEEVSNMVLFLASDEASYSTGSEFVVDGGMTAQ